MTIYAMAGVYLLFMAYNLMKSLPGSSGNENPDTEENADTEENPATDENPEENNGEE